MFNDLFAPQPDPQGWQLQLDKGDLVVKDNGGILVYQRIRGRTRTPKRTLAVEGFSAVCSYGECGDTYIYDTLCLVDEAVWKMAEAAGWPARLDAAGIPTELVWEDRNGTPTPILHLRLPEGADA